MAETQTLNFGPEWLRALSGGGSVTSPPLSPALPKYKLADYRYGREEMLALYIKDNKIPVDLQDKEFLPVLQEEPLPPLALVPFTEEEQRNFSTSVNSAAVLRLMGRGGGTVAVAPRGRSSSRGRGRGRGEGGFYQRSFDDVEGGFGRGAREMHRSQSWEERGDRRFEKPGRKESEVAPAHFQLNHIRSTYEDGGTGATRKHDFTRSESENWRTSRDEQNGEEDEGGWRLAGPRRDGDRWRPHSPDGLRSSGWREHADQRRRFPFDSREEERGYRRSRLGSGGQDDERDSLPEWCLDDADEEMGTFDSSGAFLSLKVRGAELSSLSSRKKAPKEPIPEEAELDFRPSEECEEHSEKEDSEPEETKEADKTAQKEMEAELSGLQDDVAPASSSSATSKAEPSAETAPLPSEPERTESPSERSERPPALNMQASTEPSQVACPASAPSSLAEGAPLHHGPHVLPEMAAPPPVTQQTSPEMPSALRASLPFPEATAAIVGAMPPLDMDDDEGLKHFEQEAEKMVAYLQDNTVDDDRLVTKMAERTKPSALPVSHEAALKWFYKDPQGEIQGPFSNQEMVEWFQAGYFAMTLLVKRGCDEVFQPLGEVMKMWGRVPFTPGPSLPPLLSDVDQERLKRQRELTALNLYQLQQLQYQYLLRQQYAQALAQQHKAVALGSAQQQQHQQQLSLLLQQYQALKMRTSEPPVTRSMSVPDSASVWELQNPASQPSGMANIQHAAHGAWESGSVWDLPMDSIPPAPTIEQMQQLEKAKAAKMEQDRQEAELQAKRQEEMQKRREEEERKRREEEELARRTKEEALRRQREQEAALRRQKEEEERQAQERRREEEERRQREEMLRKQEEERRNQEELRRLEEERQLAEEAAARQRLQEEQKRKEQEQRRKEQELQKQQQELQKQQQELQKQQELQRQRQQQQEALRRLQQQQQQQQLAQMKLPSSSKWGQQSSSVSSQAQTALSLAEIQKLEEERERQAREEKRQQQELIKALQLQQQQQQQQQQQTKLTGWGNMAKQPATTKSLLEIQQEEAQQMQQQKKEQQQGGTQPSRASTRASNISNSVWGSVNNSTPQWSPSDLGSSIWGSPDTKNSSLGFWDETVKEVAPPSKRNAKNNKSNANLGNTLSSRANKKVEEEEKKLLKLFQGVNNSQDGFTQWCEHTLHALNTANNLDVPTFASFLKEVDSPYEVHDYVRAYLGDTPEAKDFAKHFLERRAKQKPNQQPKQQQKSEPVWGVNQTGLQSIFQSNHASLQQSSFETVQSGKKKKKQKMVRADPSILGFSVNAASERLNMGEIETVEDF